MKEVYLASICDHKIAEDSFFVLCMKSSDNSNKVLPIICGIDTACIIAAIQHNEYNKSSIYGIAENFISRNGYYVSAVKLFFTKNGEIITDTEDGVQYISQAGIVVQRDFESEIFLLNSPEGILFAYLYDYPILVDNSLWQSAIPANDFFLNKVSADEFDKEVMRYKTR